MPIRVVCHSCGRQLNAPDNLTGRKAKCPSCQTILPIPAAETVDVAPPEAKERKLPHRRQPKPEERITHEPEARDEPEPVEVVEVGRTPRKPKRKKNRPQPKRSEQQSPAWVLWLLSFGGCAALAGGIAFPAIYNGHGAEVLVYSIVLAIMIPISTIILILSMFVSSWLGGGIDFGEAHIVIPKAFGLLFVVNLIGLAVPFGGWASLPIWVVGLMFLFNLDMWETRTLVVVNWALNYLGRMAVFLAITAAFAH